MPHACLSASDLFHDHSGGNCGEAAGYARQGRAEHLKHCVFSILFYVCLFAQVMEAVELCRPAYFTLEEVTNFLHTRVAEQEKEKGEKGESRQVEVCCVSPPACVAARTACNYLHAQAALAPLARLSLAMQQHRRPPCAQGCTHARLETVWWSMHACAA